MEFTFFVDNAGSISPSIEHFHRHILRIVPNIIIHEICFHSLNFNLHDLSNVILRLCISFVQVQRQTEVPTRKRGSRPTDSGKNVYAISVATARSWWFTAGATFYISRPWFLSNCVSAFHVYVVRYNSDYVYFECLLALLPYTMELLSDHFTVNWMMYGNNKMIE